MALSHIGAPADDGPGKRPVVREDLRRNNLASLVRNLHLHGPLSRSELTGRTGLNRSTVGDLVGELGSVGLVRESSAASRGANGRPSHLVSLDGGRACVLCVEIASEALAVSLVGLGGQLLQRQAERRDWRTGLAPADAVAVIAKLAEEVSGKLPHGGRLLGAAVAVPGIVRRRDGFVHLAPTLGWDEVALGPLLSSRLPGSFPVVVANEADLGALAECVRGNAVGSRHVIYISGNTGIGAGIVVEGALLGGRSGYAGEVGHMKLSPDGHRCRCGGRGCWETEIGAAALLRRAGRQSADAGTGVAEVLAQAQAGEPKAVSAVRETGRWVGRGAANLVNIFNPDLVVFGGTLREVFLAAEPYVREELARDALPQPAGEVRVVAAGLGSGSVVLGAAELAFSDLLADPMAVLAAPPPTG